MIFEYDELKECVTEDFERFYNLGFNEKQIYPAVLNEYEHGKDFCPLECICIHVFLILNYKKCDMPYDFLEEKLSMLLGDAGLNIEDELGDQYQQFLDDLPCE